MCRAQWLDSQRETVVLLQENIRAKEEVKKSFFELRKLQEVMQCRIEYEEELQHWNSNHHNKSR